MQQKKCHCYVMKKERVTIFMRVVYLLLFKYLKLTMELRERQDKNINFESTMTNLVITKNKSFVGIVFENRIIFVVFEYFNVLYRPRKKYMFQVLEHGACAEHFSFCQQGFLRNRICDFNELKLFGI